MACVASARAEVLKERESTNGLSQAGVGRCGAMITSVYLQEKGNGKLGREETILREEFLRRGLPVTLFTRKRIERRQLPLTPQTFIAGDIDAVHGALSQLKIEWPLPEDYPESLKPWLHRRVWRWTLGDLERSILEGSGLEIFAKPADRRKAFVGNVFSSINGFREIGSVSRRQDVWCSEVVEWRSEYRVYAIGRRILSVDRYWGDAAVLPDLERIRQAVDTYVTSGEAPAAFALDFGVLGTGETALVEANDAYSLGAYQIGGADYADVLLARWEELMATKPSAD